MPQFDQSNYPWTREFIHKDLRLIPAQKPKVSEAFGKYTRLSPRALPDAFNSHLEPSVKIESIPGYYGFTPPSGSEIWLDRTFIGELEEALPKSVPRGREPSNPPRSWDPQIKLEEPNLPSETVYQGYTPTELEEKVLLMLEVTVLHEMVHYIRRSHFAGAAQNWFTPHGRGVEEYFAEQFEKEAYGVLYRVQNLGIAKYFPRTATVASSM